MVLRSAQAHQVEIVDDVGATLHVEPNDTPKAGEEVLAWFALTKKGGRTIPLSDCDCELTVTAQADDSALLTPSFSAVDAEGYTDIPGARFTFPAVGAYTLLLKGSPAGNGDFTPFELDFELTVAAGVRSPTPSNAPTPEAVGRGSVPPGITAPAAPVTNQKALPSAGKMLISVGWQPVLRFAWVPLSAIAIILFALRNKQQS